MFFAYMGVVREISFALTIIQQIQTITQQILSCICSLLMGEDELEIDLYPARLNKKL